MHYLHSLSKYSIHMYSLYVLLLEFIRDSSYIIAAILSEFVAYLSASSLKFTSVELYADSCPSAWLVLEESVSHAFELLIDDLSNPMFSGFFFSSLSYLSPPLSFSSVFFFYKLGGLISLQLVFFI